MQDWDRLAMIVLGLLVSIQPMRDGWTFVKKRQYMAALGVGILIGAAVGLPVILAMFAT